jgi:hypothetical protein
MEINQTGLERPFELDNKNTLVGSNPTAEAALGHISAFTDLGKLFFASS